MSKLRVVSIDLTQLKEVIAKGGHESIQKAKTNGHLYVSLEIWDKDEKDKYDQNVSVKLRSSKENKDAPKIYVGNGYIVEIGKVETAPISEKEAKDESENLPF